MNVSTTSCYFTNNECCVPFYLFVVFMWITKSRNDIARFCLLACTVTCPYIIITTKVTDHTAYTFLLTDIITENEHFESISEASTYWFSVVTGSTFDFVHV